MSYKIKFKPINGGFTKWILNDYIHISLDRTKSFTRWYKKYTNLYDSSVNYTEDQLKIYENFLIHGYTPIVNCYGTTLGDSNGKNKSYVIRDSITWFLFDGVSEITDNSYYFKSIAVNYNEHNNTFTVYNHALDNDKRIGIFDDLNDVFNLTNKYLPVKIYDYYKKDWEIDWDKLVNENIGDIICPKYSGNDFKMQLGNIINKLAKYSYACDGVLNANYIFEESDTDNTIYFTIKHGTYQRPYTVSFKLIDDYIEIYAFDNSMDRSENVYNETSHICIKHNVYNKDEEKPANLTYEELRNEYLPELGLLFREELEAKITD